MSTVSPSRHPVAVRAIPSLLFFLCSRLACAHETLEPQKDPDDIVIVRLRADKKDALVSMLEAMEVDYRQI